MSWLRSSLRLGRRGASSVEIPPRAELEARSLADLHALAAALELGRYRLLRREDLIERLLERGGRENGAAVFEPRAPEVEEGQIGPGRGSRAVEREQPREVDAVETEAVTGVLDLAGRGHGFLRVDGLTRSSGDPFISRAQIRRLGLRRGDEVTGAVRRARRGERHRSMVHVDAVNGLVADRLDPERVRFERLTAARPERKLGLHASGEDLAERMIDLVAPIGAGQRAFVAGPPAAGATELLRRLAAALARDPNIDVITVLVDARPEEITDWRSTMSGAAVHATAADGSPQSHVQLAELALERAKRIVEQGRDAVVLLDSATRLARAYALLRDGLQDDDGRLDEGPHGPPVAAVKRWFAVARNTAERGSLTVIATARVETESDLESAVYELLADAANLELRLDAELARRGMHPAIDLQRTHARSIEGLLAQGQRHQLDNLRGIVASLEPAEGWEFLIGKLRETRSNEELLGS